MRTLHTIFAGAASLALLAACQRAASPAAAIDTAKIADALRQGEVQWNADLAARDAVKDASHYDDNAIVMAPESAPMKGKPAIQAGMTQMFASDPNFGLAFVTDNVEVSAGGDMAYTQGHFTETASDPKTHAKVAQTGSYVTVYKKEADGSWKAVQDIATAGPPPKAG